MIKEFSQLVHLMEKGFTPKDYGSGWKIPSPDPATGEIVLVDVERFAISQAKRFEFIDILEDGTGHVAVLRHEGAANEITYPVLNTDLSSLTDKDRLRALDRLGLMDSAAEECYDCLTTLAASALKCPVAVMSVISDKKQYFKSYFGLTGELANTRVTSLDESLCKYVVANKLELIMVDATTHPLAKDCTLLSRVHLKSYAGYPIYSLDHHAVGALCVIDQKPRRWNQQELSLLHGLASLATDCVQLHELRPDLFAANPNPAAQRTAS